MKRQNLRKAFALSTLMAFVITGSAYAADFTVNAGDEKTDTPTINVGTDDFTNHGKVIATDSTTVDGGTFNNTGTIETGTLDIYGNGNDKAEIAGTITANNEFIYSGIGGNNFWRPLTAIVNTPKLHIIGNVNQTGLQVFDSKTLAGVKEIYIVSNAPKTGLVIGSQNNDNTPLVAANVEIKAPIYLQTNAGDQDARIEVSGGSSLITNKIISLNGKTMVQLNGNETSATLNDITVQNGGEFSLQTLGNADTDTASFNLNTITVGDNAEFKTSIYGSNSNAHITGNNVTINLGKEAKADFGGVGTYNENKTKQNPTGVVIGFILTLISLPLM